jgi:hypothetical protein
VSKLVSLTALMGHDAETPEVVCLELTNPDIVDSQYRDLFESNNIADTNTAASYQKHDKVTRISKREARLESGLLLHNRNL